MRESYGAYYLTIIFVIFIMLFTGYMCFSINMNKAHKVKNEIIAVMQKHNGLNEEALYEIQAYMSKVAYRTNAKCGEGEKGFSSAGTSITSDRALFCVKPKIITDYSTGGVSSMGQFPDVAYYEIKVFFSVDIPVINKFLVFQVKGSTKKMYYPENVSGL